jgi:hypothetical protein
LALCKPIVRRLDRCAGDLNVFLVVLAVGLATLDASCFIALHLGGAAASMAGVTTVTAPPATINEPLR